MSLMFCSVYTYVSETGFIYSLIYSYQKIILKLKL